jgi:hypothetical protein
MRTSLQKLQKKRQVGFGPAGQKQLSRGQQLLTVHSLELGPDVADFLH